MSLYNFGPARVNDSNTYGAQRPGAPATRVQADMVAEWITFMQANGIRRVCCLLSTSQLTCYDDLLGQYRRAFGDGRVCHAPVEDFQLCDVPTLIHTILPFLTDADRTGEKVVVHCSAGSGRTGHVLAAWLAHRYRLDDHTALRAVIQVPGVWRNPLEAVDGEAKRHELDDLLAAARGDSAL